MHEEELFYDENVINRALATTGLLDDAGNVIPTEEALRFIAEHYSAEPPLERYWLAQAKTMVDACDRVRREQSAA